MSVFGVKYRLGLIDGRWASKLYAVIANSLKSYDGVMPIAVGGFKDHIHILYSSQGKLSEEEILARVKSKSSRWINENRLTVGRFGWQKGGGHFSYSKSQVDSVRNYIHNQAVHHSSVSFREEYARFLTKSGVEFTDDDLPEELA